MTAILLGALVVLPAVSLLFTWLNLATWSRGRVTRHAAPKVSVLIPARDEADNIEACVRAALAAQAAEVIVFDDGSTDETPDILARIRREDPRLVVVRGGAGLPAGWLGKPHACARLAEHATQSRLLFIDADVRLSPSALLRLDDLHSTHDADLVTAVPRQDMQTFAERLLMPMLHLTYTSWFWLPLVLRSRDPRFLAAMGQVLSVRKDAYEAIGGFAAVRAEVVDDMAFCRAMKVSGRRVLFADGFLVARCRMYAGLDEIWGGFTKNLYPGIGARPSALAVVLTLYTLAFVAPWVALAASPWVPGLALPAGLAVLANVLTRAGLALRLAHPAHGLLLQPLAAVGFCAIAIGSWWRTTRGQVTWRGRALPAPMASTTEVPSQAQEAAP